MLGRAAAERSRDHFAFLTGLLFATAFLLAGCGGGGGGGGGGGSGDAYSISSNSVSFSAAQGGATPPAQTVNVAVNFGTVFIVTTQSGAGFSHTFQITGGTTGVITITPFAPITAGTFTGTITVRGCASATCGLPGGDVAGSPKIINVTYTVSGPATLSVSPPTIDFETTVNNTPASQNVTLSLSSGSLPWSHGISYTLGTGGWLTVNPQSGTLNPSQVVTLSASPLGTAAARVAEVTFTAGALTRVLRVNYTVNAVGVNFVSPYVGTTNLGGDVIIRGYGFAGAPAPTFGGIAASSFTPVSDTEIRATYPALAAGTYAVQVGTLPTRANLVVVNPPANTPGFNVDIPRTGDVANLIYDAERRAIFVMNPTSNQIERYRFSVGAWLADGQIQVGAGGAGNPRIALSPDGTELLKTPANGTLLWRVNPDAGSWTVPAALLTPNNVDATPGLGSGSLNFIAFANDGRAVGNSSVATGTTLYRYDMLNRTFGGLSAQQDMLNRGIVASGDGGTLVLPNFDPVSRAVVTYDASAGVLTSHSSILTSGISEVSVSRDGSRMILLTSTTSPATVYSFTGGVFASMGNLPGGLTGFVISPDGASAYAYYPSPPNPNSEIRKFNLNVVGFPQTGVAAVNSPGTSFNSMTISPDGGTLFMAGNQGIRILLAP